MYNDHFPGGDLQLPSPFDIDTTRPLYGAFGHGIGHSGLQAEALWIVRLCQKMGGWYPFTLGAIEDLYQARNPGCAPYSFARLAAGGWIEPEPGETERFRVTLEFVARCYKASPAEVTREAASP